ncbi:MAG: SLBB domain-containing protein, partial [Peptococcaceae bacterium]|nr:SLBB domain-containing protein [Peptococcaceae bacterium]
MIQLDRKQQLVILLLVGVILFGGGYRYAQLKERAANQAKPALEAAGEHKSRDLLVHVTGAVTRPGVYQLPQGARVIDAVNKAGPSGEADLDALKLASAVTDGQSIYVPAKHAAAQAGAAPGGLSGAPAASAGGTGYAPQAGAKAPGAASAGGL